MKVSPLSQGTSAPGVDLGAASTGRTSPSRIAVAKAIAAGEDPINVRQSENNIDPQVERIQKNIRKIKMRTNVSPDRFDDVVEQESASDVEPEAQENGSGSISVPNEQSETQEADATKPLSPQFAALAKQRRALQVKEREIADREKALSERSTTDGSSFTREQLLSDPLGIMTEAGVSYEALTEAILNGQTNPEISALKAEIKALREGVDTKLSERDTQQEQQALSEMRKEANALVINGDTYKYTRAMGKTKDAVDLIHKTWKQSGEIMDVSEALELIEAECKKDYEELAKQLTPAEQIQVEQQQNSQNRQMKTLTNRDGARPVLDRRARALAAFHNRRQG